MAAISSTNTNTSLNVSGNLNVSGTITSSNLLVYSGSTMATWGSISPISYSNNWYADSSLWINELKDLPYSVYFGEGLDELSDNISHIKKKKIYFNCSITNNRIQPYELIMKLIEEKRKMDVKIEITNTLTINYHNLEFTEMQNNINFIAGKCDFSLLKVKFKDEKVLYDNHKLNVKQKRTEKINKILKNADKIEMDDSGK